MIVDDLLAYEELAETLPVLLRELGVNNFELRARAKSEYRQNPLLDETAVTEAQRLRIYRAFLPTLKLTGLYPVEDELVAARFPLLRTIGSWRI